jgi:hypothetical protein
LQVLGAVAQLERSLISERTRAGIKAAKARGKKPGNPGMRERRPEAIRKIALAREKVYLDDLLPARTDGCQRFAACVRSTPGRMLCASSATAANRGPWPACDVPWASSWRSTWPALPSSALPPARTRRTAS